MIPFSPKPRPNLPPKPAALLKLTISLGGMELRPDLSGALHVPELSALIISDLHLEQGTSLARRGIRVPPFDTNITIGLLENVVARFAPRRVIFLGDSFHDDDGETRVEAALMQRLQKIASAHECFWICGNHDPSPPRNLSGHAADHILLGPLTLRHEPKQNLFTPASFPRKRESAFQLKRETEMPAFAGMTDEGKIMEYEIAGHLHPGCAVSQRGRRVSGKCFIADERRLIMPAFGAYTGALSVFAEPYQRLFKRDETTAWMIGQERLYKFPFERLC